MREVFDQVDIDADIEKILKEAELNNLILDKRSSSSELAHVLSVVVIFEDTDFETPVLWLDGDNSFNPYKVSELSLVLGLDPELALQEIRISRAFTCYQMTTLICERLDKTIREYGSEFVVITGLPSLFSSSDLRREEALQEFDPLIEDLKDVKNSDLPIFMTAPRTGKNNVFASKIESVSGRVIGLEKEKNRAKNDPKPLLNFRNQNATAGNVSENLTLEEFA